MHQIGGCGSTTQRRKHIGVPTTVFAKRKVILPVAWRSVFAKIFVGVSDRVGAWSVDWKELDLVFDFWLEFPRVFVHKDHQFWKRRGAFLRTWESRAGSGSLKSGNSDWIAEATHKSGRGKSRRGGNRIGGSVDARSLQHGGLMQVIFVSQINVALSEGGNILLYI